MLLPATLRPFDNPLVTTLARSSGDMIPLHVLRSTTSEDRWLRSLVSHRDRRLNLLLVCASKTPVQAVVSEVSALATHPLFVCNLPGQLELPAKNRGTLVVADVAALTIQQQIELYDWIGAPGGSMQVVSISSVPLRPLVQEGQFLEGLHYRLNTVVAIAAGGNGAESEYPIDPVILRVLRREI